MSEDIPAQIKLYVKEQADKARNQAIGIFGFIAVIIAILSAFGVNKYVNDAIKMKLDEKGITELENTTKQKMDEIRNLHDNAVSMIGEIDSFLDVGSWDVTQILDLENGSWDKLGGSFTSNGGTMIIFASGSGYSHESSIIGMYIELDGKVVGTCKTYTNERQSHKSFVMNPLVLNGISAGEHVLGLKPWEDTQSDNNDFYCITILEFPF
ncbi:hypothetical protein CEE37_05095 [candidate division LCP-89 bacterium B3_LCP]|uniref:Uncharacterized protein n=1 Tax=candidate division LCP-89 bacterium B3_LCP TaxID=2012998 RepID=A0A532V1F0_UNCL8|nr:MAG: hypothetical protein CEE37_05095 [candidate division LCP-89 bacterium B3_LCP]